MQAELNWAAVSAIASAATFTGTLGLGGVMWGRLTERVQNQEHRLDVHRKELNEHERRLNDDEREIAVLQDRRGYRERDSKQDGTQEGRR